jgi:predicted dithiol-disulfide oxidoreductase (DUF899 family)
VSEHRIGTREEWQAARDALLEREKELTHRNDELARERRELPWVPVEKEYSFETDEGTKSLPELFDGRSQLLIYQFMFGPAYDAGCPVCSSIADNINPNVPHVNARDVTMICAHGRRSRSSRRTSSAWDGASTGSPRAAATSTSTTGSRTPMSRCNPSSEASYLR